MVCRENTVNSALISSTRLQTGLTDVQTIGLLHSLHREAPADSVQPEQYQYQYFLRHELEAVASEARSPHLSPARRASIVRRLRSALESEDLPSGATWWAQERIAERSRAAAKAQERFFYETSNRSTLSPAAIRTSFHRHMRNGIPADIRREDIPPVETEAVIDGFPVDRHSQWAAYAVRAENGLTPAIGPLRCNECGQFKNDSHVCDSPLSESATFAAHDIYRCEDCYQFIGRSQAHEHAAPVLLSAPSMSYEMLERMPSLEKVHENIKNGVVRFGADYNRPGSLYGADYQQFWAGIGADGRIEAGPIVEEFSQDDTPRAVINTVIEYLNKDWDQNLGKLLIDASTRSLINSQIAAQERGIAIALDHERAAEMVQSFEAMAQATEPRTHDWDHLERCSQCGQFIGQATHECFMDIMHVESESALASEFPLGSPLLMVPQTRSVRRLEGEIAEFTCVYRDNDALTVSTFYTGVAKDGVFEVWTDDDEVSDEILEILQKHFNKGWARWQGEALLRHQADREYEIVAGKEREVALREWDAMRSIEVDESDPEPSNMQFSEDYDAFRAVYDEARKLKNEGASQFVPFMKSNATNGIAERGGGRGFGIEIEYSVDPDSSIEEIADAIGDELYRRGILAQSYMAEYHCSSDGLSSEELARFWRFERDQTVSGEIISPILYDTPQTWKMLEVVCDVIRKHGGYASIDTGNHVHVGVGDFGRDVTAYRNLLGMLKKHEDTIYRLAQNPHAESHRGFDYCSPLWEANEYETVEGYASNFDVHHNGINLAGITGERSSHVEFRMWDGSLDPGVIQAQIKTSLMLTEMAIISEFDGQEEPLGSHASENMGTDNDGTEEDTANFRRLLDSMWARTADKEQLAALFATTRWQTMDGWDG